MRGTRFAHIDKNALGKERKITVKNTKRIKEMIRTVGKDYKYCERTDNMMKRSQAFIKEYEKTYDKIEKIENLEMLHQ